MLCASVALSRRHMLEESSAARFVTTTYIGRWGRYAGRWGACSVDCLRAPRGPAGGRPGTQGSQTDGFSTLRPRAGAIQLASSRSPGDGLARSTPPATDPRGGEIPLWRPPTGVRYFRRRGPFQLRRGGTRPTAPPHVFHPPLAPRADPPCLVPAARVSVGLQRRGPPAAPSHRYRGEA